MGDKRAGLAENPIRIIRRELKKTQGEFAQSCGIHVSGLYLVECGAYSHIFPSILSYLHVKGYDKKRVEKDYRLFIRKQRENESTTLSWADFILDSPSLIHSPFLRFREKTGYSRADFCKRLCIQPALVYRLENGELKSIPSSVELALLDVGVQSVVLEQLNEQLEEFYYGKATV